MSDARTNVWNALHDAREAADLDGDYDTDAYVSAAAGIAYALLDIADAIRTRLEGDQA